MLRAETLVMVHIQNDGQWVLFTPLAVNTGPVKISAQLSFPVYETASRLILS